MAWTGAGDLAGRLFRLVEAVTILGVLLIVAVSALLFGGVEPLHRAWVEAACFALFVVAALQPTLFRDRYLESRRRHSIGRRSLGPLLAVATGLLLYGSLTCLPVAPWLRDLVSPGWKAVAALSGSVTQGEGSRRALSLNVQASREAVMLLAACLALFISALVGLRKWRHVRRSSLALLLLVCGISALALSQSVSGEGWGIWSEVAMKRYSPPMGPFVNRNHFGAWASMGALLGVGYLFSMAKRGKGGGVCADLGSRRAGVGFMTVLIIVAVVFSLSRGAMLGMLSGLAFFCLLMIGKGKKKGAWGAAALLTITAVVVAWIGAAPVLDRLGSLAHLEGVGGAAAVRLGMNRDLLRMAGDFPWTGSGPGTFSDVYPLYQTTDQLAHYSYAHNDYLQFLAEWGAFGVIIVLVGVGLVWRKFIRRFGARRNGEVICLAAGAASAVFALMVQSLVDFSLHVPAVGLAFTFMVALMLAAAGARTRLGNEEEG